MEVGRKEGSTGTSHLDAGQAEKLLAVGRSLVADLDPESIRRRLLAAARELTGARAARLGSGRTAAGVLSVPIDVHGEPFGALELSDRTGGGEFSDHERRAAATLADWAGVALGNARLYASEHGRREELERAVRSLEATTEIARAVGDETDLDAVLDLIAQRGRELVHGRWAAIIVLDGQELEVGATAGELPMRPVGRRFPLEGTLVARVLSAGRLMVVDDLSRRARADDQALVLALGAERAALVPLEFRGRQVGVLMVAHHLTDPELTEEQGQLMEAFAASAATAIATAQTIAANRLSQSLASAERERRRWARELHDETLQELGAVKIALDGALRTGAPEDVLGKIRQTLAGAIDGLHQLINELRPAALDALGVAAAVEALVERRHAAGLEIDLEIDLDWEQGRRAERLLPEIEGNVYRIVQEALTNVAKHARASTVTIRIVERDGELVVAIRDDGRGFDPTARASGLGLIGMRERVALLGGRLEIEPRSEAGGTAIRATAPARHVRSPGGRAR